MAREALSSLTEEFVRDHSPDEFLAIVRRWLVASGIVPLLHPLGFFVAPLKQTANEEWRFHVWPAAIRQTTGMPATIHTHDRIVESTVLKGSLQNITYDMQSAASPYGGPVYEARYEGDRYDQRTENVLALTAERLVIVNSAEAAVSVGSTYRVPAHAWHQAVVAEGVTTCTVVRMHSRTAGPVKVLGIDGYPPRVAFKRPTVSVQVMITASEG